MPLPPELTRSQVEPLLRKGSAPDSWELDLSGVSRIDSVGVALLLEWNRMARHQNQTLVLDHASPQVRQLLEFYELTPVLTLR